MSLKRKKHKQNKNEYLIQNGSRITLWLRQQHILSCVLYATKLWRLWKGITQSSNFVITNRTLIRNWKGDSRKICNENLKKSVRKQTACIITFAKFTNSRCEASYRVAYHLGVVEKSYSDGELVKRCLIDVVKCIHSGKEADYSSIALSRVTMQRRQDDIAQQLKLSLQAKINKKESSFSLAVDESTDINDSAQLLIFVCCLSSSFELWEDYLFIETLATRTPGENIFIAVKNASIRSGLDLKCLRGICTDGAPAMTGNQQGFVTRFADYMSNVCDNKELINLHCIIHQETLCAKYLALNTILWIVLSCLFAQMLCIVDNLEKFYAQMKHLFRTYFITPKLAGCL